MLDGLDTVRGRKRCRVRPRLAHGSAASTAKVRDPSPTRASDPRDAEMTAGERGERCNVDVREVDPLPDRASPPAPGRGRGRGQGRATILVRARDQGRGRDHALYHVRVCVCVRARVRAQPRLDRTASVVVAPTRAHPLAPSPPAAAAAAAVAVSVAVLLPYARFHPARHPHAPQAFESPRFRLRFNKMLLPCDLVVILIGLIHCARRSGRVHGCIRWLLLLILWIRVLCLAPIRIPRRGGGIRCCGIILRLWNRG